MGKYGLQKGIIFRNQTLKEMINTSIRAHYSCMYSVMREENWKGNFHDGSNTKTEFSFNNWSFLITGRGDSNAVY